MTEPVLKEFTTSNTVDGNRKSNYHIDMLFSQKTYEISLHTWQNSPLLQTDLSHRHFVGIAVLTSHFTKSVSSGIHDQGCTVRLSCFIAHIHKRKSIIGHRKPFWIQTCGHPRHCSVYRVMQQAGNMHVLVEDVQNSLHVGYRFRAKQRHTTL